MHGPVRAKIEVHRLKMMRNPVTIVDKLFR